MLNITEKLELLQLLELKEEYLKYNKIESIFSTPENRGLYPRHMEFIESTNKYSQLCFLGGNRTGKTVLGTFLITCWMTGVYPDWYNGRKFDSPVNVWIAGNNLKTVRDILQYELLGLLSAAGTGMIPKDKINRIIKGNGVANLVDTLEVKSMYEGMSLIGFKSFDSGRITFQGTSKDIVWLDEESPQDIYEECLLRTLTTNGIVILTFTPLMGITPLVQSFIEDGEKAGKKVITCTWDDCGHLSKEQKNRMLLALPPFQRDARSKGVPYLGSGSIYPIKEEEFTISPFAIPDHWPRIFAIDPGWNYTACIWVAVDLDSDISYVYSEYKQSGEKPSFHADAIKTRKVLKGVIDPAGNGTSQTDGNKTIELYRDNGLELSNADNSVEAGILAVWEGFCSGKLKIFNNCQQLLSELRLYRRSEGGKIVKSNDHLSDAMRYCYLARSKAEIINKTNYQYDTNNFYAVNRYTRVTL